MATLPGASRKAWTGHHLQSGPLSRRGTSSHIPREAPLVANVAANVTLISVWYSLWRTNARLWPGQSSQCCRPPGTRLVHGSRISSLPITPGPLREETIKATTRWRPTASANVSGTDPDAGRRPRRPPGHPILSRSTSESFSRPAQRGEERPWAQQAERPPSFAQVSPEGRVRATCIATRSPRGVRRTATGGAASASPPFTGDGRRKPRKESATGRLGSPCPPGSSGGVQVT